MNRRLKATAVALAFLSMMAPTLDLQARGGGGGGRGGGGGGGGRVGGGGGGMSRPSPSISRSPSMSRPSPMPSRPSAGMSRPSTPSRPSIPSTRPATGISPGSRPGSVDFARPSTRPGISNPGLTPGSRPGISQLPSSPRPGVGSPGIGAPGISQLPSTRPGVGSGGIAARPGFPGNSTAQLPGLGNRPGIDGARPSQLPGRGTPQERRGDLENRLSQRDQNRDQFQNNRDQIREDWHDHYDNFYDRHDDWHHGCWNGNASDWWHHMWDDHTALMVFGTTMWGVNRLAYGFGYWGYENPYYTESYPIGGGAAIDYSQPMAMEPEPTAASDAPTPGMEYFDAARLAFYQKDYATALAQTNKALGAMPNDPIIHEFRALVLFAQGGYKESAAGLYSVLSAGPGWDWTTLISLYPDLDTYTAQLRKLEDYVRATPESPDGNFVLAYHYLTGGNKDAATARLKVLYKLMPQDKLVQELLLMTGGPAAIGAEETVAPTTPSTPVAAIPLQSLVGKWSAMSASSKFALEITADGNFTWTYSQGTATQTVKGVAAIDGNVLALEPESGGVMLAEITAPAGGSFDFQMLGTPPGDPGLKFTQAR